MSDRNKTYANNRLVGIQRRQLMHDELFHRDIARLPTKDRLTHLVLHCSKYCGYLYSSLSKKEDVLVDFTIVTISILNTLNSKITLETLDIPLMPEGIEKSLVIQTGRLASACERIDHLEDWSYKERIIAESRTILGIIFGYFDHHNLDLFAMISYRLEGVQKKSIFYKDLIEIYHALLAQ